MPYFRFSPLYQERVWGGTTFTSALGRSLPEGKVIGESWEIVDRPEAQSVTVDGKTLRELIEGDPVFVMGDGWEPQRRFPILVKWLDCREKLSLQVHPPAAVAPDLGGEPKTENWFIAEADPDATLMAGLKAGVTREQFDAALQAGELEPLVHTFGVRKGQSIFIPSGRIHAIGGGNLILEVQQNSDTTYRVYDWGRVGLDGQPRQLHIEESLRSIDFADFEPEPLPASDQSGILAECAEFRLRREVVEPGTAIGFAAGEPRILSVISGILEPDDDTASSLVRGDNVLLPAGAPSRFTVRERSEILVTERFV